MLHRTLHFPLGTLHFYFDHCIIYLGQCIFYKGLYPCAAQFGTYYLGDKLPDDQIFLEAQEMSKRQCHRVVKDDQLKCIPPLGTERIHFSIQNSPTTQKAHRKSRIQQLMTGKKYRNKGRAPAKLVVVSCKPYLAS